MKILKTITLLLCIVTLFTTLSACKAPVSGETPPISTPTGSTPTEPSSTEPSYPVTWDLHATYLTDDGEILDSFPLSVEIDIDKKEAANDLLSLRIDLPETFVYTHPYPAPLVFESLTDELTDVDYYICDTDYIVHRAMPKLIQLVLCEKMEYLLLYWPEDPGKYLVASRDADVAAADILTYFDYYLHQFSPQPITIQHSLRVYCKVVSTDWRNGKVFPGTFQVTVTDYAAQRDTIQLSLTHYGDYYYSAPFPDELCELTNEILDLPYLTYTAWGLNSNTSAAIPTAYAYDPEMQYFIAMWDWDPNNMLVASLDEETEAETILAHFQEFIERYSKDN